MSNIDKIQGNGLITDTSGLYTGTPPNVYVFDGSTRIKVSGYDPPINSQERTYLTLHKVIVPSASVHIWNTQINSSEGEYLNDSTVNNIFLRIGAGGAGNNLALGSALKSNAGKWHTGLIPYLGNGTLNDSTPTINGVSKTGIQQDNGFTGSVNSGHFMNIGGRYDSFSTIEIAILAIFKGLFTAAQKEEFAKDPFGFMERLRANPTEKAKLYLDIDFNKTGTDLPEDLGTGNGGSPFPISLDVGNIIGSPE